MNKFPFLDKNDSKIFLENDLQINKIQEDKRDEVFELAWKYGVDNARKFLEENPDANKNIIKYLENEGVQIKNYDEDYVLGKYRYFCEYFSNMKLIKVYVKSVELWCKENGFDYDSGLNLILCHEFFHHLEWHKIGLASRLITLPMLKIGKLEIGKTGMPALSEVAANAFAYTLFMEGNMANIYTKEVENVFESDVLVIGAGPAGFGAAMAAARNGAKVTLLERGSVVGGMATAGLVGPFMTCYNDEGTEQIVKGIFDELCLRTEKKGGAIHPSKVEGMTSYSSYYIRSHKHVTPFDSDILATVMDEMLMEAGVKVLFQVQAFDAIKIGNKIEGVYAVLKEGLSLFKAKTYIDCTGDADIAQFAGLKTWYGDERNGKAQPSSLFFEIGNVDRDKFIGELENKKEKGELGIPSHNCWSWYIQEAKKNGDWDIDRDEIGNYEMPQRGRFKMNTTRMAGFDATKSEDISKAIMLGRKQVLEVMNFLKKYVPGCENVELIKEASTLGVRETRHIEGRYKLTVEDIMSKKHFDDAICTFGYAVDIHDPNGDGGTFQEVNSYYTIPFRSLLPLECDNLVVAGRSICGTSEAAASYRVMPCCIATGQAAGTAAALVKDNDVNVCDVDTKLLKETLIKQDFVIKD